MLACMHDAPASDGGPVFVSCGAVTCVVHGLFLFLVCAAWVRPMICAWGAVIRLSRGR